MRELSLFSGAGGGLLGSILLGWITIGYVEYDSYCQRVIAQRIADGILPVAPIFGDVRTFIGDGYAASYTGLVDVLSGGFPCQPFSLAGRRAGAGDERNMWPATAECVRIIRPRYCFFENVPGLLSSGYFGRIVADLAACGYGVRWRVLSAAELGAPHKRDRLWIIAHAAGGREPRTRRDDSETGAYYVGPHELDGHRSDVADTNGGRRQQCDEEKRQSCESDSHDSRITWWGAEPEICRVVDGYAGRVAELKAAGNAQVASVAAAAWSLLTGEA